MRLEGEQSQAHVGENEVLRQEVQQLKQLQKQKRKTNMKTEMLTSQTVCVCVHISQPLIFIESPVRDTGSDFVLLSMFLTDVLDHRISGRKVRFGVKHVLVLFKLFLCYFTFLSTELRTFHVQNKQHVLRQ